jgi:anti-sigma factor RsiW
MTHEEARALLHALVDSELDAGHALEVEAHVATCSVCAPLLRDYRAMQRALSAQVLADRAPPSLRASIEKALPRPSPKVTPLRSPRGSLFQGFALGSVMSAAIAASLALFVARQDEDQLMVGDVVSAHLRSLQPDRLIDVQSTSEHTVKPWFNGKIDLAPPVIDLTAAGFPLIGGRLDYVEGRPVAAIVYKRRAHVINLFVEQSAKPGTATAAPGGNLNQFQGFHVWRWSNAGLDYWAVSDLERGDFDEFTAKLAAGAKAGG